MPGPTRAFDWSREMELSQTTNSQKQILWLLFWNFFKIALFVVGGGMAIMLAAEQIFVKKLRWLREGELLDMFAVIQTVPGLVAGNAAIYVGYRAAGHWGALSALFGVALPSFTVITLVSMGFASLPLDNPWLQGGFIGVRTALSGLMLATLHRLWVKTMKGFFPWPLMLFCFLGMTFWKANPGILLLISMIVGVMYIYWIEHIPKHQNEAGFTGVIELFLLFCYFGLLCIGGGSLLISFYINELVDSRHWMTLQELGDFMAISQVTPGPIGVNLATFIGYKQHGIAGALAATVGLLVPSYILMVLALKSLERWESSKVVRGIMRGVQPATVGLVLGVLLVCLEMSVFSTNVPWEYLWELTKWDLLKYNGPFYIRYGTVPLFFAAYAVLYKDRCSIMTAIFSGAAYGIFFCRP